MIDGTPIRRPRGQRKPPDAAAPEFGPSRRARHRAGDGLRHGSGQRARASRSRRPTHASTSSGSCSSTIGARATFRHGNISRSDRFSASRLRRRSRPGSSRSSALEPFRVAGPPQEPAAAATICARDEPWAYEIRLAVELQTQRMRERGIAPRTHLADDVRRHVLERRAAARARDRQRRGRAPGRSLCVGNDQRLGAATARAA